MNEETKDAYEGPRCAIFSQRADPAAAHHRQPGAVKHGRHGVSVPQRIDPDNLWVRGQFDGQSPLMFLSISSGPRAEREVIITERSSARAWAPGLWRPAVTMSESFVTDPFSTVAACRFCTR